MKYYVCYRWGQNNWGGVVIDRDTPVRDYEGTVQMRMDIAAHMRTQGYRFNGISAEDLLIVSFTKLES